MYAILSFEFDPVHMCYLLGEMHQSLKRVEVKIFWQGKQRRRERTLKGRLLGATKATLLLQ